MKTLIAIIIALNTVAVFAVETESKCGQVDDSVERSNDKSDAAPKSEEKSGGAAAQ
jgi:hypothetical protein